jgi:hypothetical protein
MQHDEQPIMTPHDDPDDSAADAEFGQRLRRALRALPDAPALLQRAAIGLWPGPTDAVTLAGSVRALWGRVAAVLAFDSWAAPALATGMRSLRSPTRQLLYRAGSRDIDLRIAPADRAWSLAGQVLGSDEPGRVELTRLDAGAEARGTPLDAVGEFRLDGVASGIYSLTLYTGADEVLLPPFDVGEPAH